MKKLLVLVLVLCMASLANAALQLSINGVLDPVDSELTIRQSETVIIDVWTNTSMSAASTTLWAAVLDPLTGSLGGNGHYVGPVGTYYDPTYGANQDNMSGTFYANLDGLNMFPGKTGAQGTVTIWNSGIIPDSDPEESYPNIPANTKLFDGIVFHCEGIGDAIIQLYTVNVSTGQATLRDTVIIHQIPEPATLAILGLGALLLRRK